MTKERMELLIAEQKRTNELSEGLFNILDANIRSSQSVLQGIRVMRSEGDAVFQMICAANDLYQPPRYAGAALTEALQLAEKWLRSVKGVLSIGMIPSPVPGELIRALTSLPNTLSQLEPMRGADQPDSSKDQIPT